MSEAYLVRDARESDRAELAAMFARCSVHARYQRFHGHVTVFPERYLAEALAGTPAHRGLVAVLDTGSVVALASCRTVAAGTAELGFLVEDAWQRAGIGRVLLREITSYAARNGLCTLIAQVLAEQSWIVRVLGEHGTCESVSAHGVLDVTVRLDVPARHPVPAPRR